MAPGAQCVATLRGHTHWINCVTLLPDGRFVSGSPDKTLKIWDPSKEPGAQCVATLRGHTDGINCILLLPDGRFVSGSSDGTLKIWDPSKDRDRQHNVSLPCRGTLKPGAQCVFTLQGIEICCVTLLPDGRFVSGSFDNTLKIWDPSMEPGHNVSLPCGGTLTGINCILLLPDGRFVSFSSDDTLKIWDPDKHIDPHKGLIA